MSNKLNITIEQNASLGLTFNLREDDGVTPTSIAGWTFTGSIKQTYQDAVPLTSFTMSVNSISSASVEAFLSADQTWLLNGSTYVYDFIANNPNTTPEETYRLMYGRAKIIPGVTQP